MPHRPHTLEYHSSHPSLLSRGYIVSPSEGKEGEHNSPLLRTPPMACRKQAAAGPVASRRRCNSKKRSAARGPRLRGAKGGGRHRNGAHAPRQPTFNGYHSTLFTIHTIYKQWCAAAHHQPCQPPLWGTRAMGTMPAMHSHTDKCAIMPMKAIRKPEMSFHGP